MIQTLTFSFVYFVRLNFHMSKFPKSGVGSHYCSKMQADFNACKVNFRTSKSLSSEMPPQLVWMIEVGQWLDVILAHPLSVYWVAPVHKALVRSWVKTLPRCLWADPVLRVVRGQESLDGVWHWRINCTKTGRVKVLMAHFLLFNDQDKPWGRVTRISRPDTEGIKRACWSSVNYMLHASWSWISLFIFSAWRDSLALYNHCHKSGTEGTE